MCFRSTRYNVSRSRCLVIRPWICAQTSLNGFIYIFTHIWFIFYLYSLLYHWIFYGLYLIVLLLNDAFQQTQGYVCENISMRSKILYSLCCFKRKIVHTAVRHADWRKHCRWYHQWNQFFVEQLIKLHLHLSLSDR
jgi:hypothetical protein